MLTQKSPLFQLDHYAFQGTLRFGEVSLQFDSTEAPGISVEIVATDVSESYPEGWDLKVNSQFIQVVNEIGQSKLTLSNNEFLKFKKEENWLELTTNTQQMWIDTFGNGVKRLCLYAYPHKDVLDHVEFHPCQSLTPFSALIDYSNDNLFFLYNQAVTYLVRLCMNTPTEENNVSIDLFKIEGNHLTKKESNVNVQTEENQPDILTIQTSDGDHFELQRSVNSRRQASYGRAFLNDKEIRLDMMNHRHSPRGNKFFVNDSVTCQGTCVYTSTQKGLETVKLEIEKIESRTPYDLTVTFVTSPFFKNLIMPVPLYGIKCRYKVNLKEVTTENLLKGSIRIQTELLQTGQLEVHEIDSTKSWNHQWSCDANGKAVLNSIEVEKPKTSSPIETE